MATACGADVVVVAPGAGLWRGELSVAVPKLIWGHQQVPEVYSPCSRNRPPA